MNTQNPMLSLLLTLLFLPFVGFAQTSFDVVAKGAEKAEETVVFELTPFHSDTPEGFEKAVTEACRQARRDFEHGSSKFIVCGLPSSESRDFAELLRRTYQIIPLFHGCVVSGTEIGYASTYNEMTRLLFLTKKDIDLNEAYSDFLKQRTDEEIEPNESVDATPVSAPR